MSENGEIEEPEVPASSGETQKSNSMTEKGKQQVKEKLRKRIANSIKSGAAKQSLMAALGPILLWAFVIIVILIIIIGIAMFLVTMPGMVMEQLKALIGEAADYVAAFFGADTTEQIKETEMYSTLDYLEQMGWDLKGEGFLTDYVVKSDETSKKTKDNLEDGEKAIYDEKVGVIRNDNDKIVNAYSDFIFKYIASDNYIYTLKNNNLVTHDENGGFLSNFINAISTAWYKIENFFFGPLYDVFGVTDSLYGRFGKGLIGIYYEKDNKIGRRGNIVNTGSFANWDSLKINTSNKTLSIAKNSLLDTVVAVATGDKLLNNAIEFSLDGWTGRYGMPIEFLLAIHKATLMPDLAYDMTETFGTEVEVLLRDITGSAIASYKTSSGDYIDFNKLMTEMGNPDGNGFFDNIFAWFDNLQTTEQEALVAFKLGIEHAPDCECEKGTVTAASYDGKALKDDDNDDIYDSIIVSKKTYSLSYSSGTYTYQTGGEDTKVTFSSSDIVVGTQEDEYTKICDKCKDYITKLSQILDDNTNYHYSAYMPYISKVTDHWYRDVYFTVDNSEKYAEKYYENDNDNDRGLDFIEYDYDYQIMTGERWTLYETDEETGDFVYYKLKEDGSIGDKYEGTVIEGEVEYVKGEESETLRIASIGEDGTKVIKKAVTLSSSDSEKLKDLGWNPEEEGSDFWTAYGETDGNDEYQPLFEDEDEDEDDEESYESIIKSNCYIHLQTEGNIIQTGEGQRTVTNPDIKKMFLQNYYFRYDGTDTTAEIIAAMREKIYGDSKNRYGPIDEKLISEKKEYELSFDDAKYTSEAQNGTYKLSDYVGNVTLNQDSLNAFTMLENTHTLDADYIYRDFKELVVELGYFKKEELTDETPKLLQWIVPDIGSSGYPDRTLDKRENEFGTMVHSKSDIEVNKLHTLYEKISQMKEEVQVEGNAPDDENVSGISTNNNSQKLSQVSGLDTNSNINLKNVKGASASFTLERVDESGDGYESVLQSGNVKYIHRYQGGQSYSNITFFWAGGSRTLGQAACGLFACFNVLTGYGYEFDPTKDLPGYNWPATMDAVKNLMEEKGVTGQFIDYTDTATLDSALNEGRPAILLVQSTVDRQGVQWTGGGHFIALAGKDKDGNILTLDSAAQGNVKRHDYPGTVEDMTPAFQQKPIWIADEPPTGMKKDKGDPYEGYEGNEAVVSPVTGILLDYGTYEKKTTTNQTDEENTSKVTTEDPRVNVDLKYGFPNIYENSSDEENGQTGDNGGSQQSGDTGFKSEIVSDKVGYAKILVLDAENYQKLESATKNQWQKNSLVRIDQTTVNLGDTDQVTSNRVSFIEALNGTRNKTGEEDDYSGEYEDWSAIDKTVYGYKEFAEAYEKYGIAGYVVYIDGFKCELPDESLSGGEESEGDSEEDTGGSVASEIPNGKTLTMESFKQTGDQIDSEQNDEDSLIQTKYESDEVYKLASEKSTNKLSAEVDLKTQAAASISIKDDGKDLIFIKEGTVIGRTLTDKELLESADFRNGKYGTYEELRGESKKSGSDEDETEDDSKLIGNYLRIILQDEEGTTIENVEDYMKLDEEGKSKSECEFEQLAYYLGVLEEGFYEHMDLGSSYGVEVLNDGAGNTTAFGLTKAVAETVASEWPSFATHLASGTVPKDEAQDVFILVLEAAKESIQNKLTTPLDEDDSNLFALIDLHHASPTQCEEVISIYNSKNNNLSAEELISVFSEHWGTNENYGTALRIRGTNRGLLASEGRFFLYQEGSVGDEVLFDTETPWTEFCEAGGTYEMTRESSGLYHIEKAAYTNYSVSY